MGFSLSSRGPWASCTREHPGSFNCGKSFGVSLLSFPWDWSLLLSPSVQSPTNLCVTIASGQPPVWLCSPLVWSSTLLLMKATSQALEGKEGSPGRTALQRNTKGDIASTVPRDR